MDELESTPVVIPEGTIEVRENQLEEKPITAEDICAQMVHVYADRFINGIEKLSGRQVRRLVKALVLFPMRGADYKPTTQLENDLFNIGDRILQAKHALILNMLAEKAQKEYEQQENAEVQQPNNQGENNG